MTLREQVPRCGGKAIGGFDFLIEYCPRIKNPTDAHVPSRRSDLHEDQRARHTMLPTLQEKLHRGL
jgi:hypothetical protein